MFGEDPAVAAAAHAPSCDALDRASALLARRYISVSQTPALVEDIAKLIDAVDAAAVTEVKPLVEYQGNALAQIESHDRVALDRHRRAAVYLLERKSAVRLLESAIAELEWLNWRCDGQRADLRTAANKLEIADRQRREFKGHADTALARVSERESYQLATTPTDTLLEELRRRLTT